MKKVITYGTFDLFHEGHYNLLKRAKELGDYLIVGVTSRDFDMTRGKLNVCHDIHTRIKNIEATGFVDEIIIEEYFGQKIDDIQRFDVDIFTVGSDWKGTFDYLKEYCEVVYLERTKGVSSTQIRNHQSMKLGIFGAETIVKRFLDETRFVSGIEIAGIYAEEEQYMPAIKAENIDLPIFTSEEDFWCAIDAVYITVPPILMGAVIQKALTYGKHILCEFPLIMATDELKKVMEEARKKELIFALGLKTAYCPAFQKLVAVARSGIIGNILEVDANFSQINHNKLAEQVRIASGGSVNALASYPLLAMTKLLGHEYKDISFISRLNDDGIDIFTKMIVTYEHAVGTAIVAIDAKTEGDLVISGEKGCIYVPAPWWKTEYFEVRFENLSETRKYFYKFDGEGLRYEIAEFARAIKEKHQPVCLSQEEIMNIAHQIFCYQEKKNVLLI